MSLRELVRGLLAEAVARLPPGLLTDRRFFERFQQRGVHASRVHFYSPIPDTRELGPELWERPRGSPAST